MSDISSGFIRAKSWFGDEYPAAIAIQGVRLALVSERRWTRVYASKEPKMGSAVSRLMDGSATIAFRELAGVWPDWSERERQDFCGACSWLGEQRDFADMLRFMMQHGSPHEWSVIANSVATRLPQAEAFDLLTRALRSVDLEDACNIAQGVSLTKHPEAVNVLRTHLAALWSHPSLWETDDFCNWWAYGATFCIKHLIEVGASAGDFSEHVQALARHPCSGNRDSCGRFLATHYPWLDEETDTLQTPSDQARRGC